MVTRYLVILVELDQTRGLELQKTRPCVVLSPTDINMRLRTVVIAPITSTLKKYPTRIPINQENVQGSIAIVVQISLLDDQTAMLVSDRLVEFFHY